MFQQGIAKTQHFQKFHITKELTQCIFGQNSYSKRNVLDKLSYVSLFLFLLSTFENVKTHRFNYGLLGQNSTSKQLKNLKEKHDNLFQQISVETPNAYDKLCLTQYTFHCDHQPYHSQNSVRAKKFSECI